MANDDRQSWEIRQAQRNVEDAKRQLQIARDSKSKGLIAEAQEELKKAQQVLRALQSDNKKKAREAQRDFLNNYYRELVCHWC